MNKTERRQKFFKEYPNHCTFETLEEKNKKLVGSYGNRVLSLIKRKGVDFVKKNHIEEYRRLKKLKLI